MSRVTHLNINHRGSDGAEMDANDIPFTPAGTIASTNVQAAIEEVATEAGGSSGPFVDIDSTDWKFDSTYNTLRSSDTTSYITWYPDELYLAATSAYIDLLSDKVYLAANLGMVVPVMHPEPSGGDSENGQFYYNDNSHRFRSYLNGAWVDVVRGALVSITSPVAIANTETVVTNFSMDGTSTSPSLTPASTFRIRAFGRLTSGATGGSSIFRCRIGTTTLTGTIPATLTIANGALVTNAPFTVEMLVTVRTAGASGTVIGNVEATGGVIGAFTVAGAVSAISATVAIDTTVNNLVEFTYISGNAGTTATFENVVIELLA